MEKKVRKSMRKRAKNPSIIMDYSFVKILTGSDLSRRRLPLMSVKSLNPGPTVWFTAGAHGDEVGGIAVIQELFKKLRKDLLKGMVYAFPMMNPMGFETSSRLISISEEDLNRSFPGDKEGSLAERMAERTFSTIIKTKPDLVLDLHSDWKRSIPYVLLDPPDFNKETYEKVKHISIKSGFPVILDTEETEGTLSYSLMRENIPSFTIELGESYVVNEKDVVKGVNAIWKILLSMGMVGSCDEELSFVLPPQISDKVLNYSSEIDSHTSGIIRFLVKPGEIVEKGRPVAKVYNAFGKLLETITAREEGIVLGYSDYSVAFPGGSIMAFGIV